MKRGDTYTINKKLLLAGDHTEILRYGDYYSRLNSMPQITYREMVAYLAGKPVYLGEQTKGQWGMSFEDARRCLYDVMRTELFIKGIVAQLNDLKKNTNHALHVVEAGGGTGILAIAAALAGAEKVTLLEINSETLKRTKAVIESLGLADIITVVFANASNYIPDRKIDMLICECLHTGLAFEPQLQIVHHLGKFLQPKGKLVPEGVMLRWSLANADWTGIDAMHTEYRNIKEKILYQGKWSQDTYVDFASKISLPDIESLEVLIPADKKPVNTILVQMDVHITTVNKESFILKSGQAGFLGHPHAIRLNESYLQQNETPYVYNTFRPGEKFSHEISPFIDATVEATEETSK